MNKDFSIETSIDAIQNSNTRIYFNEVYQTFVNGNYRSSVVMLYSVLICDLVYKLRDLRDLYNDSKATKILDEIEKIQNENPKSPDWESKLIEFISSRLTLLEPSDVVAIESLQKFRHLSAHPVLTNSDLLYNPDRDTVRSLIRNILTGVLINPPFFSNKIFDTFLNDLSDIKDKITDRAGLKKYITSRYLNLLKDTDLKKLFRSLWKVIFISENLKAEENREINFKALIILLEKREDVCLEQIKKESKFYSNINKDWSLNILPRILALYPSIYKLLESPLLQLLNAQIEKNDNLILISWFRYDSLEKHWEHLKYADLDNLSEKGILFLRKIAEQNSCLDDFNDFIIEYFIKSNNWEKCQNRYDHALSVIIDDINLNQMKRLLSGSNENPQIYNRIGMPAKLKRIVSERFKNLIDEKEYNKIYK